MLKLPYEPSAHAQLPWISRGLWQNPRSHIMYAIYVTNLSSGP